MTILEVTTQGDPQDIPKECHLQQPTVCQLVLLLYTTWSRGGPGGPGYQQEEMGGFSEASVRRGFIRKVYGILLCQLIITGGLIAAFMFVAELKM